jgi:hypothetical protein
MPTKKTAEKTAKCPPMTCNPRPMKCGGAGYFIGFIGAAVYYISTATGFWNGVLGVLKALVWPAILVYGIMKYLGM